MEPFGLFQFLQSLLNSPAQTTSETPKSEGEKPSENIPSSSHRPVQNDKNSEAFVQFMQEHDRRSRRTKYLK